MARSLWISGIVACCLTSVEAGGQVAAAVKADVASPDVNRRIEGFGALMQRDLLGREPRALLRDLLLREIRLIDSVNTAGTTSVSEKFGEGYGEYVSEVLNACARHCDRSDPLVIRALVKAPYGSESPFAIGLARDETHRILPILIEEARDGNTINRVTAQQMLGTVSLHGRGLSVAQRGAIHAAIVGNMSDTSVGVRLSAIRTLGAVGTRADIPRLEALSADTLRVLNGTRSYYPARETAAGAIRKILARDSTAKK